VERNGGDRARPLGSSWAAIPTETMRPAPRYLMNLAYPTRSGSFRAPHPDDLFVYAAGAEGRGLSLTLPGRAGRPPAGHAASKTILPVVGFR